MNDTRIRDAFHRLNADIDSAVDARSGLTALRSGRSRARRLVLTVAAASVVAASIVIPVILRGNEDDPVGTAVPSTASPSVTTTASDPSSPPTSVPPTVEPTDSPTTIAPGPLSSARLLVADADGVWAIGPQGSAERLAGPGGRLAVAAGPTGYAVDTDDGIAYLAGSGEPVLVTDAEETIRLVDVTELDDDPWLIAITRYPGTEGFDRETVVLISPRTAERRTLVDRGAGEGGISRVSHAEGLFVLTWQSEGESWLEFVDQDGAAVDVANPKPYESFGAPYVDQAVLSPDGRSLAVLWSESNLSYDASVSTDLVVYDVDTGEETERIALPVGAQRFLRLDWNGDVFVISRDAIVGSGEGARYALLTFLVVEDTRAGVEDSGIAAMASVVK